MNVLSLFDGLSGGRIALDRLGIKVDNYYASEIDKYAISVAKYNYPNTVHLGDVQFVTKETFGNNKIDLLIGGSPCQGFSFAGKQLNFDDERSKLFFEYVRLLRDLKPKYFMLENVRMKKESQDVITEMLGVEPITINSKLVSAQNRHRLYWTNIPQDGLPQDEGILLRDILSEDGYKEGVCEAKEVVGAADCHHVANATDINGHESIKRVYKDTGKAPTLTTMAGGHRQPKVLVNESATPDNKSYCITARYNGAVAWNSCERKQRTMIPVEESNEDNPNVYNGLRYRKLTPVECERLQTIDDNYTAVGIDENGKEVKVSNTQRYKMIGNGWTIKIIEHIFKNIE